VLNIEETLFEPPPKTLTGASRELIRGTYKLKDHLMLLLDIDKALQVEGEE
jgi:purine-binding chemotaxis protein CheW